MAASDQQTRKTRDEESQSSITAEGGKESQIRPKKKSPEVKDRWVKVKVTMDSRAAAGPCDA